MSEKRFRTFEKETFLGVGEYGIPEIMPEDYELCDWIGFNYAIGEKSPERKGVHFFLDDYQFERVWNAPDKYIKLLYKYKYVLSPDFSTYTDYPKAVQIYNHYRKHWLAAYWQLNGITVIPTISWSDENSFDWCFDGEPVGATVAVSSVGTQNGKEKKELFLAGYEEMMKRLRPETILFMGEVPEECGGNIIKMQTFSDRLKRIIKEVH